MGPEAVKPISPTDGENCKGVKSVKGEESVNVVGGRFSQASFGADILRLTIVEGVANSSSRGC